MTALSSSSVNRALDMGMEGDGQSGWHPFWASESPGGGRVNSRVVLFCLFLVKYAFFIKDSSHKPVNVSVTFPSHLLSRGLGS